MKEMLVIYKVSILTTVLVRAEIDRALSKWNFLYHLKYIFFSNLYVKDIEHRASSTTTEPRAQ